MLLRWGICGCGEISTDFTQAIKLLPHEEHKVTAVGASSLERAQKFVKDQEIDAAAFGKYDDLFQSKLIDVVYIGLLNHQHKAIVMSALKHGKHVVCEKPLALNAKQVQEIVDCARKHKRFLLEGYWTRFFPVWNEVKEELKSGELGDLKALIADFSYIFLDPNKMSLEWGGGVLMATGCYLPMLACYLFEEEPLKIVANGVKNANGVDESACVTLEFSGGRFAQLFYSGTAVTACQAQVCTTNGLLQIPDHFWCPDKLIVTHQNTNRDANSHQMHFSLPETHGYTFKHPNGSGMLYEAEAVRKAIRQDQLECAEMPWSESIRVAKVMDEIRAQIGVRFPQDS